MVVGVGVQECAATAPASPRIFSGMFAAARSAVVTDPLAILPLPTAPGAMFPLLTWPSPRSAAPIAPLAILPLPTAPAEMSSVLIVRLAIFAEVIDSLGTPRLARSSALVDFLFAFLAVLSAFLAIESGLAAENAFGPPSAGTTIPSSATTATTPTSVRRLGHADRFRRRETLMKGDDMYDLLTDRGRPAPRGG